VEGPEVTERFTRVGEERIHYSFTAEDPTFWEQPWGGEYEFAPLGQPLYEYACHEGNYALPGILMGERVKDWGSDGHGRQAEPLESNATPKKTARGNPTRRSRIRRSARDMLERNGTTLLLDVPAEPHADGAGRRDGGVVRTHAGAADDLVVQARADDTRFGELVE
jgi:hypothetical protein